MDVHKTLCLNSSSSLTVGGLHRCAMCSGVAADRASDCTALAAWTRIGISCSLVRPDATETFKRERRDGWLASKTLALGPDTPLSGPSTRRRRKLKVLGAAPSGVPRSSKGVSQRCTSGCSRVSTSRTGERACKCLNMNTLLILLPAA